jgi:hypothetical protein
MTTNKDFKRIVRTRMRKTGEAYTAARANVLSIRPTHYAPRTTHPDYAKLAGMSDASVKKATGCTWERWVKAFDKVGADQWPHRKIVDFAVEKYKTPDWWAQMVVVGYERIRGLRAIGQRRGGSFEATKSKVFAVPVGKLYRAFSDAGTRSRWLPDVKLTVRTKTKDKSFRANWPDGTSVEMGFYAKGAAKSSVAITHSKLADKADADQRKAFWAERFGELAKLLA